MLGAIAGDIIGSVYEIDNILTPDFEPLFHEEARPTDDSVLTCAIAEWLLNGAGDDLAIRLKEWFFRDPLAGFGSTFIRWAGSNSLAPYNSWGNGSAMRVSPVGWAFNTLAEVLEYAQRSAAVTHDHPEGIKGAQATASAVFLARQGSSKDAIREYIQRTFGYDLTRIVAAIRPTYRFDVSCQGSVPQAITAFLESTDVENAIRLAISLGGDSDTIACIAGGIAEAFYGGLPAPIRAEVDARMTPEMRSIAERFALAFPSACTME